MLGDPFLIQAVTREHQQELRRSAEKWRMARAFRRRKLLHAQVVGVTAGEDGPSVLRPTTVVARVCLGMPRARKARAEERVTAPVTESVVSPERGVDPEQEVVLADSIGLA